MNKFKYNENIKKLINILRKNQIKTPFKIKQLFIMSVIKFTSISLFDNKVFKIISEFP